MATYKIGDIVTLKTDSKEIVYIKVGNARRHKVKAGEALTVNYINGDYIGLKGTHNGFQKIPITHHRKHFKVA